MEIETFEELISKLSLDEFYESNIGPDNKFIQIVDKIIDLYPEKCKILLDRYKDFGYPDEQAHGSAFLEIAVEVIEKKKDINDLPLILSYFDDSIEATDIFDCLTTQVAKYSDPEYTESLLDHLSVLLPHAVEWASYLLGRIFNSGEKSHKIVWNHLHKCPQAPLKTVLENMLKDEGWEHLFTYIRFLLKELDKKE